MDINKLIDAVSNYKLENKRNAKFLKLSDKIKKGEKINKDDDLAIVFSKNGLDHIAFKSEKILFTCDFSMNPYKSAYTKRDHEIKYSAIESFKIINGSIYINEDKAVFKRIDKKRLEHYWEFFKFIFNIVSPKILLENKETEDEYKVEVLTCRSCGNPLPHGLKPDTKCSVCGKLWLLSKRYIVEDYRLMFTYKDVEKCIGCGYPIRIGKDGQRSCTNQYCTRIVNSQLDVNHVQQPVSETIVEKKAAITAQRTFQLKAKRATNARTAE